MADALGEIVRRLVALEAAVDRAASHDRPAAPPRLFAVGAALAGSPVPAGSGGKLQVATNVVTTNANGDATIIFPAAFVNGLQMVVVCNGDGPATGDVNVTVIAAGLGFVNVRCFNQAGAGYQGLVRINWFALGW